MAVSRDGWRDAQVLSTGRTERPMGRPTMTAASPGAPTAPPVSPPAEGQRFSSLAEARNGRPKTLTGVTKKIRTGHGSMYVTMNDDEFGPRECLDRKSTRLNSSHANISYAVFCLKKKIIR